MRILVHPQTFNSQRYGGISRYYTEVLSRIAKNNSVQIPLFGTSNVYYNESSLVTLQQSVYSLYVTFLTLFGIRRLEKTRRRNDNFLNKMLAKQNFDIFIPTYYDTAFLNFIGSKPFILTVYDMIYELFPEYFITERKAVDAVVANKLVLMQKAARIIAVSENTKKDILNTYPHIDQSKIDVVYHGCSITVSDKKIDSLPKRYLLFVGTRSNYKNFEFLVNSIQDFLKTNSDLFLLCAGGGEFDNHENTFIKQLNLENKIIYREFKEGELGLFYKNAICFVFPSLYEGFGIPVLEAMTCGCPVVLSHHSSFPEVAGYAGVYYETGNAADLKNKIQLLTEDPIIRDEFSKKGVEQAKNFSWEKASVECLNVYKIAICAKL
jgi:glycosyltransferase involved in cell wall biosynthesis